VNLVFNKIRNYSLLRTKKCPTFFIENKVTGCGIGRYCALNGYAVATVCFALIE
jgi:hypothetical protein